MPPPADPLYDAWYMVGTGRRIKPGKMVGKKLLGQGVMVGRSAAGEVFALRDICPHRGIPLSHGRFDGKEVECCYHGWKFDCAGTCTHIPSLLPTQNFQLDRVKVRQFPCREVQGLVWVYVPAPDAELPDPLPPVPLAPGVGDVPPGLAEMVPLTADIDNAVIGLMDPAHGPFVHRSWFWRSGKAFKIKSKEYAPSEHGFTMTRHTPSSNSAIYRVLFGPDVSTEIRFELPATRIEHICSGKNHVVGMTTITPVSPMLVEFNQIFWWTVGWMGLVKPFLRSFVRRFISQDQDVLNKQQAGLIEDPQLILINDADKMARWYLALKKEWVASRAEGRAFVNPVPHTTLHWRT